MKHTCSHSLYPWEFCHVSAHAIEMQNVFRDMISINVPISRIVLLAAHIEIVLVAQVFNLQ